MNKITALILAAGEGKRMKSKKSKLTKTICGKTMIEWVYDAITAADINNSIVIVGHKAEQVMECMGGKVKYALQEKQMGTGHAVMQAEQYFTSRLGYVLVLCGDTPLVTANTIAQAVEYHKSSNNTATVITAIMSEPTGYGRIKRDADGNLAGIVEQRDATEMEKAIREINSGMYLFSTAELFDALKEIDNDNDQCEYYLTDVIRIMGKKGLKMGTYTLDDPDEVMGVNDNIQLQQVSSILRERILKEHMLNGVNIIDCASVYIDAAVEIGADTVIYPGTIIESSTKIGEDCVIGPYTRLVDAHLGNGVKIANSIMYESTIGNDATIGPFAYIRPESSIGNKVKIGDFVEIKKSKIGNRTKIPHLAYIGDAEIGENTNIACGVITVNYDGKNKSKTIIGNNAFVGCNVNLVAPVKVEDNAYIAAGSTITESVPENALAIARNRQVNKEGWVLKKDMKRVVK